MDDGVCHVDTCAVSRDVWCRVAAEFKSPDRCHACRKCATVYNTELDRMALETKQQSENLLFVRFNAACILRAVRISSR